MCLKNIIFPMLKKVCTITTLLYVQQIFSFSEHGGTSLFGACIQRETWDMGPYAGADLTLSHSHIRSPAFHSHDDDECFLIYSKIEQPIGKGRVRGRGREGVGADFMPYNTVDIIWIMGIWATSCLRFDSNLTS